MVKKLVEAIGLEPERVRLEWISAAEGVKFADTVRDFVDSIKELGPNPLQNKGVKHDQGEPSRGTGEACG
jgi:coenzyme F420-reducing hydrogenase delta subunit